ncbi:TniQ family protein [Streptomyces sp. NPDC047082]|uniref:TniQ family protein n=1 Tax=Streptomyces sp. NPDC047082 TaxID=3155259 RepID=UPI00340BCFC8
MPTRRHRYLSPLRVAPMQWETTASYIQRLAQRHHLTTTELLHALGIPTPHTHPECTRPRSPSTTIELYLNPASRHLITQFTGIENTRLTHALPQWGKHRDKSPTAPPKARLRLAPVHAITGCPHCTLTRTGHAHPVQQYLSSTALICRRHRIWMLGTHTLNGKPFPTEHADLTRTPEILAAHQDHTRLLRRWGQAADHGLTYAMALTDTGDAPHPPTNASGPPAPAASAPPAPACGTPSPATPSPTPKPSPSPSSSPATPARSTSSNTPADPTPSTPPSPPSSAEPG